ncbi:MAG TPA: hypothetical protein PKC24_04775 [Cyclobacteriaceae bacterium]|nr:hypothetical protein [Cyclobacteriaceae bacterium]
MKGLSIIILLALLVLPSCEFYYYDTHTDPRDRVTGVYFVHEYSQTFNATLQYEMRLLKSTNRERVLIENFYDAGITVSAIFQNGKLTIPRQKRDGFEIEGTGTVWGNRIDFTFSARDTYQRNKPTDFCTAEAWRSY